MNFGKNIYQEVVAVAQLVERSLPTPEVCGLYPVTSKIDIEHLFSVNCME